MSTTMSYQQDNGKDDYVPINGNGHSAPKSNMKKWILGGVAAILVALVAVAIFHKPAGKSTKEAMAKADLPVSDDGTLMLFDDLSECGGVIPLSKEKIDSLEIKRIPIG
jgi:hypothetical protein